VNAFVLKTAANPENTSEQRHERTGLIHWFTPRSRGRSLADDPERPSRSREMLPIHRISVQNLVHILRQLKRYRDVPDPENKASGGPGPMSGRWPVQKVSVTLDF